MPAGLTPICFTCAHFTGLGAGGWCCEAFPTLIPVDILSTTRDHHDPYPGDRGLQYLRRADPAVPPVTDETRTDAADELAFDFDADFGGPAVDWRKSEDDGDDPDDELLEKTPDDVVEVLGFDPLEEDDR